MPLITDSSPTRSVASTPSTERWIELAHLQNEIQSIESSLQEEHEDLARQVKNHSIDLAWRTAYEEALLKQVEQLKLANAGLQKQVDSAPFVMLLVDGDSTHFLDSFVATGFDGAHNAAQSLKRQLEAYVAANVPGYKPHWKIMVHIYANLHGLTTTYTRAKIVPDVSYAHKFVTGFNRELPFFEFVDAGNDKEAADTKIKDYLKHYYESANCKHVLLAGSGDNSFVNHLRQFSADAAKITLVETVPFAPSFRELAERFQKTTFNDVFKTTKLETTTAVLSPPSPRQRPSSTPAVAAPSSSTVIPFSVTGTPGSWVTVTGTPTASAPRVEIAVRSLLARNNTAASTSSAPTLPRTIKVNSRHQRIDDPLPAADIETVRRFQSITEESRRPCSRHNLSKCYYGNECKYDHTRRCNAEEKKALRRLARMIPCPHGTRCVEETCVCSHACPYGAKCFGMEECRFSEEMHRVEREGIREIAV